jgi:hypothetical protein
MQTMNGTRIVTLTGALMLTLAAAAIAAPPRQELQPKISIEPRGHGLHVRVWTDVGEGGVAHPGQRVNVFFRTDRDAYVAVYNVDTRGKKTLLFPRGPRPDGYVRGGDVVELPGPRARYDLVVRGPRGIERVIAVASDRPLGNRPWEFDRAGLDDDYGYGYYGSPGPEAPVRVRASIQGAPVHRGLNLRIEPRKRGIQVARDETWFDVETRRRAWWTP